MPIWQGSSHHGILLWEELLRFMAAGFLTEPLTAALQWTTAIWMYYGVTVI